MTGAERLLIALTRAGLDRAALIAAAALVIELDQPHGRRCEGCGASLDEHRSDACVCSRLCDQRVRASQRWERERDGGAWLCDQCGQPITDRYHGDARFCSAKCSQLAQTYACQWCGLPTDWFDPDRRHGRHCSDECRWFDWANLHGQPEERPGCEQCGRSMWHKRADAVFCSRQCKRAAQSTRELVTHE
jgi:hypothetical protein